MKILATISVFLLMATSKLFAVDVDSLKQQIPVTSDSLKAALYAQIADGYMQYDTITNKKEKLKYQNEALNYTMQALHYYSKYDDTIGLRNSFNNLAKVYHAQKKFSQAKWFILQSNTISRIKNDVPNIILSLQELASIKTDIKDYNLAMRDLNEALKLSDSIKSPKTESSVQLSYVMLYNNMKNYTKADIALKRYNFINDSIQRRADSRIAASVDSVQRKKKLYLTSNSGTYKPNFTTSSTKGIILL